jgi:dihydrofolate reductase
VGIKRTVCAGNNLLTFEKINNLEKEIETKNNQMRKVIYAIHLTIDGCCDHTKFMPDEEAFVYSNDMMQDAGLVAYGRKFYEILFPYWAEEENIETKLEAEFAQKIVDVDKIVFSRTLESADYNTRVVRTDPATELLKLKQQPGKNIYVSTVSMLPELMQQRVIDEFHFLMSPIMVGKGRRLLEDASLPEKFKLKLVDTKVFKSGGVALRYM